MDYNNKLNKGIHDLKQTSLSKDERGSMLSHILKHAENNPISLSKKAVKTTWYSIFNVYYNRYQSVYMATAFVTLLIIGGNISYAAEQALPGDLLYPVKLKVNEKVQEVLKFTPEAKVKWEETKVEKRLKEAEVLIERGDFDKSKRLQIEVEVQKNVENLNKRNKSDSERVKSIYLQFKDTYKDREDRDKDNDKNKNKNETKRPSIEKPNRDNNVTDRENEDRNTREDTRHERQDQQRDEIRKFEDKIQETLKDSLKEPKGIQDLF